MTTSFVPRPLPSCLALVLACTALPPAAAQSFGDALKRTVERAAKSEVQRKVDQETREVTRCAMGDARCVREAERRGERVEYEDDAAAGAAAGVAGGDHPLIVPYQGSRLRERKADAFNEYQRVVGRDRGQTRTQRLEGRLTRLGYDNPSGRSTFEIERNYRSALTARGFRVDWECSGRDVCGTTAGPASPGWNTINGINLGIARDVRYYTGKVRHGGGEAYVSVAVNPQVTYVQVLEAAAMDTGMVAVDADALACRPGAGRQGDAGGPVLRHRPRDAAGGLRPGAGAGGAADEAAAGAEAVGGRPHRQHRQRRGESQALAAACRGGACGAGGARHRRVAVERAGRRQQRAGGQQRQRVRARAEPARGAGEAMSGLGLVVAARAAVVRRRAARAMRMARAWR
ncbi:hypothetical protein [Pseudoxanthomonas mexicana]